MLSKLKAGPGRKTKGTVRQGAPVVLTLLILSAVAAEKMAFHLPPADAAPYHARLRDGAVAMPYSVGPWLGTDTDLPASAISLLHPNRYVSRTYQHVRTGKTASFLLIQCEDARDLLGHYPPICYVNQGWVGQSAVSKDWEIDDLRIPAMRYKFANRRVDRSSELYIDNFMVLPDGNFCRDMDGVERAAQDYRRKFFGAAQVQLVSDAGMSDSDREALMRQFVAAARPLIDEIRGGVKQ